MKGDGLSSASSAYSASSVFCLLSPHHSLLETS
jgi:hypothetical protein